jgi:hypothetical protein
MTRYDMTEQNGIQTEHYIWFQLLHVENPASGMKKRDIGINY